MKISNTDQPSPDTPERNKLIAYLREKHPSGDAFISTSSRGPGVTEEEAAAEILRVLTGMEDGTVPFTAHDTFDDKPPRQSELLSESEPIVLSEEGSRRFVGSILDDREPSDKLKAAARRYRERFGV